MTTTAATSTITSGTCPSDDQPLALRLRHHRQEKGIPMPVIVVRGGVIISKRHRPVEVRVVLWYVLKDMKSELFNELVEMMN